ncbi:MAG TPA: DnaJ domain-containing protein [Planctomycetaceae bacterium]
MRVNRGLCLLALAFGGWKFWEYRRDAALEGQARVRGAQMHLIGVSADDGQNRWRDERGAAEWRDGSGNALRLDAVWNESLTVAGRLAAADGAFGVLDGALDPATLPAPARTAGGYGLDPGRIGGVAFSCTFRSAAGERSGVLRIRAVPTTLAPSHLPSGGVDWAAKFQSLIPDGAEEIEMDWTPDGGPPRSYRLRRTPAEGEMIPPLSSADEPPRGRKVWAGLPGLFWILLFGGSVICLLEIWWWHRGSPPAADPRRAWVDDVVRLLVLTARMPREDQTLREKERSLIRSVAAAEAKRPDAPGDPAPLEPAEVDALIRKYAGECPGVPVLIGFLAEPEHAAARMRLFKRLWQMAVCDGPASDSEVEFARSFAVETGMGEAEFLSIARRYHRPGPPAATLDEARGLLEVSRSATADDVKRAYKRKAREYHPDAHAGAAESLKRLAAERFSKLGEAKAVLLAALGAVPLVGRDPAGRLVPAGDLPDKVRCFGCGAVRPGAPAGEAFQARCPKCLALLYHEPSIAAEFSRETREPATAAAGSR